MTAVHDALALLVPSGTPVLDVRHPLPPGYPGRWVVLYDGRRGSAHRLRRQALTCGYEVEKEFVPLPGWASARFLVEARPGPLSWTWSTFATVPPGLTRGHAAVTVALQLLGHPALLWLLGWVIPGRVLLARHP